MRSARRPTAHDAASRNLRRLAEHCPKAALAHWSAPHEVPREGDHNTQACCDRRSAWIFDSASCPLTTSQEARLRCRGVLSTARMAHSRRVVLNRIPRFHLVAFYDTQDHGSCILTRPSYRPTLARFAAETQTTALDLHPHRGRALHLRVINSAFCVV